MCIQKGVADGGGGPVVQLGGSVEDSGMHDGVVGAQHKWRGEDLDTVLPGGGGGGGGEGGVMRGTPCGSHGYQEGGSEAGGRVRKMVSGEPGGGLRARTLVHEPFKYSNLKYIYFASLAAHPLGALT